MHRVERRLVAGVAVHRGHEPARDADGTVQHLRHRRQAVRCARRVRDDHILRRQVLVVHAVDHRPVGALAGSRDQHAGRAVLQMRLTGLLRGEDAGALQNDVHVAPGQLGGVAHRGHADRASAHVDAVRAGRHLLREAAVHAVVAKQVGVRLDRAEVVERDHLDVVAARFHDCPQDVAADPAESVDRYLDGHGPLLFCVGAALARGAGA